MVVAKPGLDGHDRGAKVIARALRDAGMEVIYTGLHQTPEQIVDTAIQEDADAIGLSILSGAHNTLFAEVIELLKEREAEDIKVFGGGIIPEADIAPLKEQGVAEIFTPGATTHRSSTGCARTYGSLRGPEPAGGSDRGRGPAVAVDGLPSPPWRPRARVGSWGVGTRADPAPAGYRPVSGGPSSSAIAARNRSVVTRRWKASAQ